MRILYFFGDDGTMMWQWQYTHIVDEFQHHNINVKIINPRKFQSIDQANQTIRLEIESGRFDLFMTPHTTEYVFPETLDYLGMRGIPKLLLLFDNLLQPYKCLRTSRYFDCALLLNEDSNKIYRRYGCKCIFSKYAANPYFFRGEGITEIQKVCFVGTPYGTRSIPINTLVSEGVELDLYANYKSEYNIGVAETMSYSQVFNGLINLIRFAAGRKILAGAAKSKLIGYRPLDTTNSALTIKQPLDQSQMNEVFSKYALSLSYAPCRNTGVLKKPLNIVRLRNFEIPMCGGVQLCEYYPELAECFEDKKEILFYEDKDEMVDMARYYLKSENFSKLSKIKVAARKRAKNEHTWMRRFQPVFDFLGVRKDKRIH